MVKRVEKFFNFVVFTILVPLWFTIVSLVFFYLCKVLFQVSLNLTVILSMVKITQNALNVLL